jgi:hypothetical protein
MREKLIEASKEIKDFLENRRKELELSFIEDEHIYFMKDTKGIIRNDFPSVSKLIKCFHIPFDSEGKSFEMSNGDLREQQILLKKWKDSADYATNMGSRVHFELEKELIKRYGNYKEVRQPIFECDESQMDKSNSMITAGNKFLDLMKERGAVLLDTEIVLGDPELGYTGQPDKVWLTMDKQDINISLCVSDYKTNQPKNFVSQPYTKKMLPPFNTYDDTALTHYYIQIPLYARLIIKMLQGSKYENLKFLGGIIVLLKADGTYEEYRIPQDIINKVLTMDLTKYI